jgi:hypothetical protein
MPPKLAASSKILSVLAERDVLLHGRVLVGKEEHQLLPQEPLDGARALLVDRCEIDPPHLRAERPGESRYFEPGRLRHLYSSG